MTNQDLINKLTTDVNNIISIVDNEFKPLSINILNKKEDVSKWSILECLEHLNHYHAYYNPAIATAAKKAKTSTGNNSYKHGWFGKMSIDMMSPDNQKKQKAIAKMNPSGSKLNMDTITRFLNYQQEVLSFLKTAKDININQRKVPVEFFKLMKMKIGDALAFVVTHERRHILQAQKALEAATK